VQPMLLRALQEREVTPVGSTKAVPVDLQLVTATHRDLPAAVERRQFRADLLARLSGFTLSLPPLRERREDLGLIAGRLLERLGAKGCSFSLDAGRELFSRAWPMNVRELEKALQVGAALAGEGNVLESAHLPPLLDAPKTAPLPLRIPAGDEALRGELVRILEESGGNVSEVARAMGKARMQVQRWLKRFGLDPIDFR
jgi:transcriptional regulator of acetoin/glycerol metabolism